jgi:hypothetical protein
MNSSVIVFSVPRSPGGGADATGLVEHVGHGLVGHPGRPRDVVNGGPTPAVHMAPLT